MGEPGTKENAPLISGSPVSASFATGIVGKGKSTNDATHPVIPPYRVDAVNPRRVPVAAHHSESKTIHV
jgi:hypothetical protein